MTRTDTTPPADALIKLLERQQALVGQLETLADRQAALIEAGDTEALLEVLSQRQQLMDQFVASQDSLGQLAEATRNEADAGGEHKRRVISELIDDVSRQLGEVMRRDEADQQRMESARGQLGQALAGVATARQAQRAYVQARAMNNRYADEKG